MSTIYLPGQGNVSFAVAKLNKVCQDYDPRCTYKQNPETGQMCVYIQMPRGYMVPEMPVKGWEHEPTPDELHQWLWEHDTQRHGDKFRTDMNARNDKRKAEKNYQEDQKDWQTAEYLEHVVRKSGDHPFHKSLRKVAPKQKN